MRITYNSPVSSRTCVGVLTVIVCLLTPYGIRAETNVGAILSEHRHPCLACTTEELGRLRQAYHSQNPERQVAAGPVREAEGFIGEPVVFPPRGGQHNQWYQCDI